MTIDPNYELIKKSIVTNIFKDSIYQMARHDLADDLKEYNISIYSIISDFYLKTKR